MQRTTQSQDVPEISFSSFGSVNLSSLLEKILFAGVVFILVLPLIGDYGPLLFPLGRDVIFKITIEFLFVIALLYWALRLWNTNVSLREIWQNQRNLRSLVSLSLFAFLLVMLASTIFSPQPSFSFWGNMYKNQGYMTWDHYIGFYLILLFFFKHPKQWRNLFFIAIGTASVVSIIGIAQALINGFEHRIASMLGNPNFLAAYLLLIIPISVAFFAKKPSALLGAAMFLQIFAFFLTQTRGAYLGFLVSSFVFTVLYLYNQRSIPLKRLSILVGLPIVLLVTGYSLLITTSLSSQLPKSVEGRFFNYENLIGDSAPRVEAWQAGWQGMLKRPLLGYGPENFFVAFDEHYTGALDHTGSLAQEGSLWESWFDKAHNFIIDTGVTTGFLGLFTYLAIFISAIWVLIKNGSRNRDQGAGIIAIGIIAALIGYLVQNLFGFDTLIPGIYLILLCAYATFLTTSPKTVTAYSMPGMFNFRFSIFTHIPITKVLLLISLIIVIPLFVVFTDKHLDILRANYHLNKAESLTAQNRIDEAFATFEKGLTYDSPTVNPNLRRRYAVIALAYYNAVDNLCAQNSAPDCTSLYTDSRFYLTHALKLQQENIVNEWPRFTRNYIYAARITHILGNYQQSDMYFEQAIDHSPQRASIYVEWSRLLKERGKLNQAAEKLTEAQSINPLVSQ